jgi:hypothetical protein
MKKLISPRFLVLLAIAFLFLPLHLAAQERTLEELKEEILRRAQ